MSTPRARLALWTTGLLIWPAGTLAWVFLLRGDRILQHDAILIGGWIGLSIFPLLLYLLLRNRQTPAGSRFAGEALVLIPSVALNLASLLLLWPGLTEDLLRYRFDGLMLRSGVSPYAQSPREFIAQNPQTIDAADALIPHGEYRSTYAPTSQGIFLLARILEPASESHKPLAATSWREALHELSFFERAGVLRILAAGSAVLCTVLLLCILRTMQRDPLWAALFAWHPLIIVEFAGQSHQDIHGVALLLGAILAHLRYHPTRSGILLALACGVKPMAIVVLPFFLKAQPCKRMMVAFILTAAAISSLLLWQHGYEGWLTSGRVYSQKWEFNGSIYEAGKWLYALFDQSTGGQMMGAYYARLLAVAVLLIVAVRRWHENADFARAGYSLMLGMALLAPVLYPWYLAWLLVLLPLTRSSILAGLSLCGCISLSHRVWHMDQWEIPAALSAIEYTPVFFALSVDWAMNRGLSGEMKSTGSSSLAGMPAS